MKTRETRQMAAGLALLAAFCLFTLLVLRVDVQPVGQNGTNIGFAALNTGFHRLTGVHLWLYTLTDWLELVPLGVAAAFGAVGLIQWIRRGSLRRVDRDILLLGGYYVLVILGFLLFERLRVNYRPIPIEGVMEASYPSSTTLLVLSVMPTLVFQTERRAVSARLRLAVRPFTLLYSVFMVLGRLVSGVHWLTDILGAALLAAGLYLVYRSAALRLAPAKEETADAAR